MSSAIPLSDSSTHLLQRKRLVSYDEKTPLVDHSKKGEFNPIHNLNRSLSTSPGEDFYSSLKTSKNNIRVLGLIEGVFVPIALHQLGELFFLRAGFVVGQAGLLLTILQFVMAYAILLLTILSICAISTNGAVEGGGAYYMISRALGPEFGGSIGAVFYVANVIACALYVAGCVEGIVDNFGPGGMLVENGLPGGSRWWTYLYGTVVLAICLGICLIGGAMFARTSIFIFMIVMICTISVISSMFFVSPKCVDYPDANGQFPVNTTGNVTVRPCGNYTGLSMKTFQDNLFSNFTVDYVTTNPMNFTTVFAILFSSVTGIMNGANMSGELKDPSKSIPKGTLAAATFTFFTYLLLSFITAATCSPELLINNYLFLQGINVWPPFVVIGIFCATLSAALGNLIGASRILEALAKDELFWKILKPATITTKGGNPYVAVIITWFLVQLVLLIGSLNAIAPLTSVFFLLAYAATNLACLALDLASAPNFRPTFKYFSWHTCLAGLIGSMVMVFLINAVYGSIAIIACLILVIILHLRHLPTSWGSISQALIFHQVRKYLLMLDSRKDHVKFWRPQILLMVSNPRANCDLIEFINDVKKGGLYVVGHVKIGDFDDQNEDPVQRDYLPWLGLVDQLKVKAFVELTLAKSVRDGLHHLIRISGLGGMKPNTICFGYYDDSVPQDSFERRRDAKRGRVRFYGAAHAAESGFNDEEFINRFPHLRSGEEDKVFDASEYVSMISDTLKMNKNICLLRHFHKLNKEDILKNKGHMNIDVWPVDFTRPETANYFDNTCLFMLQLACILNMVPGWKNKTTLRVFLCVDATKDDTLRKERKLDQLLNQLRINGQIQLITWEHVTGLLENSSTEADADTDVSASKASAEGPTDMRDDYLEAINSLIKTHSSNTAVTFCYLPMVPRDTSKYESYLKQVTTITQDLPPTALIHGLHPVTSTTL